MHTDLITLIANVALTLSFVVALVFGIVQIRDAKRERRDSLTLNMLGDFQTREFAELIFFVANHRLPANRKDMLALPEKEQIMLIQFSQKMENLGILVARNFINIDLLDITLGSLITTSWAKYKPMFSNIRVNAPDPFLGEYFQWLAEQMERRMNEHPRQPFHEKGIDRAGK